MNDRMQRYMDRTEAYLAGCFTKDAPQKKLFEAMRYSLLAGGKRIRPIIVLKFAEACGEKIENVLPAACAVEMLHKLLTMLRLPLQRKLTLRWRKPLMLLRRKSTA